MSQWFWLTSGGVPGGHLPNPQEGEADPRGADMMRKAVRTSRQTTARFTRYGPFPMIKMSNESPETSAVANVMVAAEVVVEQRFR